MNLQSQEIYVHKKQLKTTSIYILQDRASGEKMGHIEKMFVENLFKI